MSMNKVDKAVEILLKVGVNKLLLDNFKVNEINQLAAIAIAHSKDSNIKNILINVASLELRGKKGAIYLVLHNIANTTQLKNLSKAQILRLVEDHQLHQDVAASTKELKQMLVLSQQEKMYTRSHGLKGEYFIDAKEMDVDEDAVV